MICPQKLKAIVFDFDGTLVESNNIKREAYFKVFKPDKIATKIINDILRANLEKSRFFIFDEIRRLFEKQGLIEDGFDKDQWITKYLNAYDQKTIAEVTSCPMKEGAVELLEYLNLHYDVFLFSDTPVESLVKIVHQRKMEKYFRLIKGYPISKCEILSQFMRITNASSDEIVVVGDRMSDQEAAEGVGCYYYNATGQEALRQFLSIVVTDEVAKKRGANV